MYLHSAFRKRQTVHSTWDAGMVSPVGDRHGTAVQGTERRAGPEHDVLPDDHHCSPGEDRETGWIRTRCVARWPQRHCSPVGRERGWDMNRLCCQMTTAVVLGTEGRVGQARDVSPDDHHCSPGSRETEWPTRTRLADLNVGAVEVWYRVYVYYGIQVYCYRVYVYYRVAWTRSEMRCLIFVFIIYLIFFFFFFWLMFFYRFFFSIGYNHLKGHFNGRDQNCHAGVRKFHWTTDAPLCAPLCAPGPVLEEA